MARWSALCRPLGAWLLLCVVLAWPAAAAAGDDPWAPFRAVRAVSVDVGNERVSMRQTTAIARDARRRTWVGGYGTLARLDGARALLMGARRTPGLSEGTIRALLPMANGDVLIGANREGLLRWDLASASLQPLHTAQGQALTRINALSPARDGGVWVSAEQGLFHWSGAADAALQPVTAAGLDAAESSRVFAALEQADGTLWVAVHKGVLRRAAGTDRFSPVRSGQAALDARIAGETAWTLAEDAQRRVWIGLVRSGVVVVGADGAFAPAGVDGADGVHAGRTIRALLWSRGRMWLGTDGAGLLACQDDCRQVRHVPVNLAVFEGRRNFHIRGLMADDDGRIWVASDRGVFHFDPAPQGVFELDSTPPGADPRQQFNPVHSLLYDSRNRLWLGMEAGEVQVLDLGSGSRRLLRLPEPLSASLVMRLREDATGKVWVAGNGVAWIDPDTLAVRPAGELARRVHRIHDIALDGGRAWLAYNDGIIETSLDGKVLREMVGTGATGLATSQVVSLAVHGGALWAGTPLGLHRIDLEQWRAQAVAPAGDGERRDEDGAHVTGLRTDGNALWAATASGVWRVAGTQAQRLVPTAALEVRSVAAGRDGALWFASVPALVGRIDADGSYSWLREYDGVLPSNGFSRNGSARGPGGTLLFGTGIGVLVVDPQQLAARAPPAVALEPVVTQVIRDGQPLPGGALPGNGGLLQLPPDHERLSVEFSALDYQAVSKYRYAYRMEGYDRSWVELPAGTAPLAQYTQLPPGNYTLALKAANEDLPGREWISRITVQVQPHWYQRADVRVAALVLLVAALSLAWWLRELGARRRRRQLEELVALRTEELQQANLKLDRLAGEDVLTGLDNRRRLFERLETVTAEAARHPRQDTLVLLDLDHFKQINDSRGHLAGDKVLREVARRVGLCLRAQDAAGRYGGEELMVLLPHTTVEEASEPVQRLWELIRATPVDIGQGQIAVTASIGVAQSQPGQSVEQWVARVDAALYQAKAQGRDRICVAVDALEA